VKRRLTITLSGPQGIGKSTVARAIWEMLAEAGFAAKYVSYGEEVDTSDFADEIEGLYNLNPPEIVIQDGGP